MVTSQDALAMCAIRAGVLSILIMVAGMVSCQLSSEQGATERTRITGNKYTSVIIGSPQNENRRENPKGEK